MFPVAIFCLLLGSLGSYEAKIKAVSDEKLINSYPIIMAHDAASGEIVEERDHVVMEWTRTQGTGLVGQLNCGARSFDYRPYLQGGVLFAHHGPVVVHKTMSSSVEEVMDWCNDNNDELVVLYVTSCDGDEGCMDAAKALLAKKNVYTISECANLQGLTYGEAKKLGKLRKGGSLIAVIECTTENYDPSLACTGKGYVCYDWGWPEHTASVPWDAFSAYMFSTTAADPTATSPNLWMAQAHWQSTTASVVLGTLHNSSLLLDESRGGVNIWVEKSIRSGLFKYLNILELDNVCDNGNNILAALREHF